MKKRFNWEPLAVGVCLAAFAGLYAACHEWIAGDWRCGFMQCRIEVKK